MRNNRKWIIDLGKNEFFYSSVLLEANDLVDKGKSKIQNSIHHENHALIPISIFEITEWNEVKYKEIPFYQQQANGNKNYLNKYL